MTRQIFKDLLYKGVIPYFDDSITETEEQHLQLLDEVFKRLLQHNVKLRHDKCQFFVEEMKYLGFIVGYNRVKPPKKIKTVVDYPKPKILKQLLGFLGLPEY